MSTLPATRPLGCCLEPQLNQLFDVLCNVSANRCGNATLRVAGGWVRDMILGRTSNDIDVTVETPPSWPELLTGATFAQHVAAYLAEHGERTGVSAGTISVIKTNPEKSKHIETAQMKVLGVPLEFCHLRHDEYTSSDHRMPSVRPGTPLEDALRRDFACNALFYNLHTHEVEDYCGGLADLERGVLRCPLAPFETFSDDPLRILRGVRFAGQLGFALDDSVRNALLTPAAPLAGAPYPFSADYGSIHPLVHALIHKVSRERAAIELTKAFGGRDPVGCVAEMGRLGLLFRAILVEAHFSEKPKSKSARPDVVVPMVPHPTQALGENIVRWLKILYEPQNPAHDVGSMERLVTTLVGVIGPIIDLPPPAAVALDFASRIDGCVVRWLKLPTRVADHVKCILRGTACFDGHMPAILEAASKAPSGGQIFHGELRDIIFAATKALCIEPRVAPPEWVVATAISAALLRAQHDDPVAATRAVTTAIESDSDGALLRACVMPPLIRGDRLPRLINVPRQEISRALDIQRQFMLHSPACSESEVVAHLVKTFGPSQSA